MASTEPLYSIEGLSNIDAGEVSVTGDGNGRTDGIEIVGDRLIVLTGFQSAQRAMYASMSDEPAKEEEEAEPMGIVCYRLDAPATAKR